MQLKTGVNRLDYNAGRPELIRIVNSKNEIGSVDSIKEALNMTGNPSLSEIKSEIRRKIQRYNQDQNPDYPWLSKHASDALNDMKNFVQNLERQATP